MVSSSANAPAVLAAAGLADRFATVVDGAVADASRAARQAGARHVRCTPRPMLGVTAATAVVLEDAVSGVRAGAAGGFGLVIGVDRGAGERRCATPAPTLVVARPRRAGARRARGEAQRSSARTRWTAGRFPARPVAAGRGRPSAPTTSASTETLFTVANGYLGMRGNPEEGRDAFAHGTFINGFHETWPIRHAEAAFGFARTGQTIVNVPDAKLMKLYVDDEPLILGTAELESYERSLDFRDGVLRRDLVWRTPSGKRVQVDSTRMVSMTQRHLAVITLEVTMLVRRRPDRDLLAAAQPPGRPATSTTTRPPRWARAPTRAGRPRSTSGCCCRGCTTPATTGCCWATSAPSRG